MQQRSPVIFWLLLAATLSVDAVATYWICEIGDQAASATLFIGLAFGQLSVLGAWAVLFRTRVGLRWLVPLVFGLLVALIFTYARASRFSGRPTLVLFYSYTGLMWAHVTLVLALLWLLKPTRIFASYFDRSGQRPWQFATKHLLMLMTSLSILMVVLGRAELLVDETANVVSLVIDNSLLLVAAVAATQAKWPWPLRLVASLSVAIIVAGICEWIRLAFASELNSFAFNLIQAIVLWSWLELMRPRRVEDVAGGSEA